MALTEMGRVLLSKHVKLRCSCVIQVGCQVAVSYKSGFLGEVRAETCTLGGGWKAEDGLCGTG